MTAIGGMTGNLMLSGLPFNIFNNNSARCGMIMSFPGNMNLAANIPITFLAGNNTSGGTFYKQSATGSPTGLNAATEITDTFTIYFTMVYKAV